MGVVEDEEAAKRLGLEKVAESSCAAHKLDAGIAVRLLQEGPKERRRIGPKGWEVGHAAGGFEHRLQ